MDLSEIQERLKGQNKKLAEFGVKSLAVFGARVFEWTAG